MTNASRSDWLTRQHMKKLQEFDASVNRLQAAVQSDVADLREQMQVLIQEFARRQVALESRIAELEKRLGE
jgi:hypothetical protein